MHLAMPLAVERAGREDGADRLDQHVVVELRLRPALAAVGARRLHLGRVHARAGRVQRLAEERHDVPAACPGAYSPPERFNSLNSSP
jgi:hypothetical protein